LPWPIQQLLSEYRKPLHYSIGILGLIVGKPLGIYLLAFLAVSAGYVTSRLNLENGHWRRIFWVELGQYS
jgi:Na+/H+ antiporter NhaA